MKARYSLLPILLAAGTIQAADAQEMKEGYWSVHTVVTTRPDGNRTETTRSICHNHAYDDYVTSLATRAKKSCRTTHEASSGGTTASEVECTMAGTTVRTKSTLTVADHTTHSETHTTYTPPMGNVAGSDMVMDQKYVGACPAGVVPGDSVSPDGKKTNLWRH